MEENKNPAEEQSTFEEELQQAKDDLAAVIKERDALVAQNKRLLDAVRGKSIPTEEEKPEDEYAFLDKIFFNKGRK